MIDVSLPAWEIQRDAVIETLERLGAQDKPMITVFNKIDIAADPAAVRRIAAEWPDSVAISAQTGEGIPDLYAAMQRHVKGLLGHIQALVPYSENALVQSCYDFGRVLTVDYREDGIFIEAELASEMRGLLKHFVVN